jgi:hypothetical protein
VLFKGALTGPRRLRCPQAPKYHLIVDPSGIPVAITLTGGHRNDVTRLLSLIDAVGPARGNNRPPEACARGN